MPTVDVRLLTFSEPAYLSLLAIPAILVTVWVWQFLRRRGDARRLWSARVLPVRERFAIAGDLPFWLPLAVAGAALVLALARPHGPARAVRQGGVDIVVLQDASASMRVKDVAGDRWRRSMRFVRTLGDALSWKSDRVALAVFAHIAAPQVRLTRDPNTVFFFLDHLDQAPPFRLEDDTTWDTNLELGIYWGLRVMERDEELHGKSTNAKLFVLLSDGEVWSGEVEKSLRRANERKIPIFVVGVGTLSGGALPAVKRPEGAFRDPDEPTWSRLDRAGLQRLASAGGGQYFELDRDGDRHIANAIIDTGKRLAQTIGVTDEAQDLYWYFLAAAVLLASSGLLFLRDRAELWIHLAGATAILFWTARWLG